MSAQIKTLSNDYRDINGREVAAQMHARTAEEVASLVAVGWQPRLVSIRVGVDPAVDLYIRNQERAARKVGIEFECRNVSAGISERELRATITSLNTDPRVTGVILQRPVPDHLPIEQLQSAIHPLKDVEGMHPASIGNIVYQNIDLAPCTAMAAVELLKQTRVSLKGLEVTVIGHSEIVGKPIAFLLMAEGGNGNGLPSYDARSCDSYSTRRRCFCGGGSARPLKGRYVKAGCRGYRYWNQSNRRRQWCQPSSRRLRLCDL